MSVLTSFPPVSRPDARLIVLGSMPGRASLAASRYYAHPRNVFWPVIEAILGIPWTLPYEERLEEIRIRRIALWDVLGACMRSGSLDSKIEASSIVLNDFQSFFTLHTSITTIFFNGAKAGMIYRGKVVPVLPEPFRSLRLVSLPSTSPAHAAMSFEKKLEAWKRIRRALDENG